MRRKECAGTGKQEENINFNTISYDNNGIGSQS